MPFGMRTVDLVERLGGTMYTVQLGLMPIFFLKATRPEYPDKGWGGQFWS